MSKNNFVFYAEWIPQIRLLEESGTEDDRKSFWDAFESFVADGCITTELTPLAKAILAPMRNQILRDTEKYQRSIQQRKDAAAKRWMRKNVAGCESMRPHTEGCEPMRSDAGNAVYVDVDVDVDDNVSPYGDDSISVIGLPEPTFVPEKDPKKLTDKMLEEEFDALWLLYPRKQGKSKALEKYKAARKHGTTFDEVEAGVKRYAEYVADKDPEYIAHGSTWFGGQRWQDEYPRGQPKPGSTDWILSL